MVKRLLLTIRQLEYPHLILPCLGLAAFLLPSSNHATVKQTCVIEDCSDFVKGSAVAIRSFQYLFFPFHFLAIKRLNATLGFTVHEGKFAECMLVIRVVHS